VLVVLVQYALIEGTPLLFKSPPRILSGRGRGWFTVLCSGLFIEKLTPCPFSTTPFSPPCEGGEILFRDKYLSNSLVNPSSRLIVLQKLQVVSPLKSGRFSYGGRAHGFSHLLNRFIAFLFHPVLHLF